MKTPSLKYLWLGIGLFLLLGGGIYYSKKTVGNGRTPETITLKIAFHKEDALTCSLTENAERTVPYTQNTANTALQELFKGPTEKETAKGISSTFEPSFALATIFLEKEAQPLGAYYRGVSVKNGVAVIDFEREALAYLNGPACIQAAVKTPLVETLLNIPSIKYVDFSIDGKLYSEWDA